jgi:hypothetical protein
VTQKDPQRKLASRSGFIDELVWEICIQIQNDQIERDSVNEDNEMIDIA